jgi:hypothetical protein
MALQKIASGHRVVLPKKFWQDNHIEVGDLYDMEFDKAGNRIILTFVQVVPKEARAE